VRSSSQGAKGGEGCGGQAGKKKEVDGAGPGQFLEQGCESDRGQHHPATRNVPKDWSTEKSGNAGSRGTMTGSKKILMRRLSFTKGSSGGGRISSPVVPCLTGRKNKKEGKSHPHLRNYGGEKSTIGFLGNWNRDHLARNLPSGLRIKQERGRNPQKRRIGRSDWML